MLPKSRPPQTPHRGNRSASSALDYLQEQLRLFLHPMFWGTTVVLLLAGWFLMEYWQPQSALNPANRTEGNSAPRNNPLRYPSANGAESYTGGGLPDLPLPAVPGEADAQTPIDPTLPLPAQSSQNKPPSTSRNSRFTAQTGTDPSVDLYNPTGVPTPRVWQTQPASPPMASPVPGANPATNPSGATSPASSPPVSPLQAALDRMKATGNNSNNSAGASQFPQIPGVGESIDRSANSTMGSDITGTGAVGTESVGTPQPVSPQTIQPSYAPVPQSTGSTMPPAFRTPGNTPSFYSSPYSSPTVNSPQSATQNSTLSSSPSSQTGSNAGGTTGSSSPYGTIGGGQINTFSNP